MRRTIISLLLFVCFGFIANAVPAKPGWQTVTQSDGTTLRIHTVGNAFNHAILTSDGLMVAVGSDGDFYYNSALTGMTAVRAHEAGQRTPSENAFVNAQRANLAMPVKSYKSQRQGSGAMFRTGGSNADANVPAQGNRHIPIILVEFKDKKFNNTREDIIDAMLSGNKSVCQYFRDQSNGLYQPDFDVYGIYTLPQNRQYYGGNDSGGNDKGLGYLVTEACQMAAASGVSFKPYDTNDDDYCDVVIVIYAGVGEAQASTTHPEAIWPCNWYLSAASYYGMGGNGAFRPSVGDPLVDMFAVFNELAGSDDNGTAIDGIGTFVHEFGHCLGLPDFYDTGGQNHYGMGSWDIMCLGCYNDNGYTPPGYSAYEKHFMGWIDYIMPQVCTYYTLPVWNQKKAETDKAVCIVSNLNENEYFIFENRKKQGWDRYMPGEGILITHVTYDADRWWGNSPNNQDIPLMTIVPADNDLNYYNESTDTWPQGDITDFTDNSTPPAQLYMKANGSITGNAGFLGKPVTEMVINPDGTAGFWYMKNAVSGPVISVSSNDIDFGDVIDNTSVTKTLKVFGVNMTNNIVLNLNDPDGVFTVSPTIISTADAYNGVNVTVTFSPTAIQDYSATLTVNSKGAKSAIVNLAGHGLIESYAPVMLPAAEQYINLTQFRADWTDQTPAEHVASYTLEVAPKPAFELLEDADFSDVPDVLTSDGQNLDDISDNPEGYLPDGWSGTFFLGAYNNALLLAYDGTLMTPIYSFSGYDKLSVVVKGASYSYSSASISVATSRGSQNLRFNKIFTDYTVVLDCAENDMVTFQVLNNYASIREVKVYAGDVTAANINATETGNSTYRLITGITNMFYTVSDLTPGGSYVYKVKSHLIDGTETDWSNRRQVTLFENAHSFAVGDVDHDGDVSITDVTLLIDYLLGGGAEICEQCADVYGDSSITIDDVTALIDTLLYRK